MGHIQRNCGEKPRGAPQDRRRGAYYAAAKRREDVDEEGIGLLVCHALAAQQAKWIVDYGATSHIMCNDQHLFKEFHALDREQEVILKLLVSFASSRSQWQPIHLHQVHPCLYIIP